MTLVPRHLNVGHFHHSRAGIGDADVEEICERIDAGLSVQHIAQQVGRSMADVQRIVDVLDEHEAEMGRECTARERRRSGLVGVSIQVAGRGQPTYSITLTSRADDVGGSLGYQIDPMPVSMRGILAEVARRHRLTIEQLKGPRTARYYSHPRQEAMWLMVRMGKWSLPQIGAFLGGRDHTTVLHGARAHQKRLDAKAAAQPTFSA